MTYALESRVQLSHDIARMPVALNAKQNPNTPEAIKAVAQEFESLFMNMMLKSMRSANRTLSEGNYFNSFESKMYEDMLDEKLSVQLSQHGGLGIADLLVRQLSGDKLPPRYDIEMQRPEAKIFPSERRPDFDSQDQFVAKLLPVANQAAEQLGIDPRFIVAQAALETGWGEHVMFDGDGMNSHNLFGIKATSNWQGESLAIESMEVKDGLAAPVRSQFKMYPDYKSAVADYAELLTLERYSGVQNSNSINEFAKGLQAGGYATDPAYGNKLASILSSIDKTPLAVSQ